MVRKFNTIRKWRGRSRRTGKTVSKRQYQIPVQYSGSLRPRQSSNFVAGLGGGYNPFPPTMKKKLVFRESNTLNAGAVGVIGTIQQYRLNSPYDPNYTGGGHSAYAFDTLCGADGAQAIYGRYKVNGVRIEFDVYDPSVSDNIAIVWRCTDPLQAATTIAGSNPDIIAEQQYSGFATISTTGSRRVHRVIYVPLWKMSGLTKLQYDADPDNYTAPYNNNPGNIMNFQIGIANMAAGSTGTVNCTVKVEYYCQFYQRNALAYS
jgi:hypothetical protein